MKPREIKTISECECGRKNEVIIEDHGYSQLEAKLKTAVEALNRVSAHGLHHNYDDETCDCGMENALNLVVKALIIRIEENQG